MGTMIAVVMFQNAETAHPQAVDPRIEAPLRIVAMIQRIAVDEIGPVQPFRVLFMEIPLYGMRKILR